MSFFITADHKKDVSGNSVGWDSMVYGNFDSLSSPFDWTSNDQLSYGHIRGGLKKLVPNQILSPDSIKLGRLFESRREDHVQRQFNFLYHILRSKINDELMENDKTNSVKVRGQPTAMARYRLVKGNSLIEKPYNRKFSKPNRMTPHVSLDLGSVLGEKSEVTSTDGRDESDDSSNLTKNLFSLYNMTLDPDDLKHGRVGLIVQDKYDDIPLRRTKRYANWTDKNSEFKPTVGKVVPGHLDGEANQDDGRSDFHQKEVTEEPITVKWREFSHQPTLEPLPSPLIPTRSPLSRRLWPWLQLWSLPGQPPSRPSGARQDVQNELSPTEKVFEEYFPNDLSGGKSQFEYGQNRDDDFDHTQDPSSSDPLKWPNRPCGHLTGRNSICDDGSSYRNTSPINGEMRFQPGGNRFRYPHETIAHMMADAAPVDDVHGGKPSDSDSPNDNLHDSLSNLSMSEFPSNPFNIMKNNPKESPSVPSRNSDKTDYGKIISSIRYPNHFNRPPVPSWSIMVGHNKNKMVEESPSTIQSSLGQVRGQVSPKVPGPLRSAGYLLAQPEVNSDNLQPAPHFNSRLWTRPWLSGLPGSVYQNEETSYDQWPFPLSLEAHEDEVYARETWLKKDELVPGSTSGGSTPPAQQRIHFDPGWKFIGLGKRAEFQRSKVTTPTPI